MGCCASVNVICLKVTPEAPVPRWTQKSPQFRVTTEYPQHLVKLVSSLTGVSTESKQCQHYIVNTSSTTVSALETP